MRTFPNTDLDHDEMPASARSRDGVEFEPTSDVWEIYGLASDAVLDFSRLDKFDAYAVRCLKWTFLWFVQNNSSSHAGSMWTTLMLFHRNVLSDRAGVTRQLGLDHILIFASQLDNTTEWKLGLLRVLFKKAHRLGRGVLTDEALQYIKHRSTRGNVKGTSIRTRDPEKGAFSDLELQRIQSQLNDAYASGEIDIDLFGKAWLLLAYGMRSVQIAALKVCDLIVTSDGDDKEYLLDVPRAKERQPPRSSFRVRHCGKPLGQLLEAIIASTDAKIRDRGIELAWEERPLFLGSSHGEIPGLAYHCKSRWIGTSVENLVDKITGIKANSKRFRNTIAQRAVDDGYDIHTVAYLLDHSDTQNARVYYEAAPSTVLRLDRALALELAPLAQAFKGMAVGVGEGTEEGKALYDGSLEDNVAGPVGGCGQMSFCGLSVPHACYTCRHFQPWIDGPHEQVMKQLLDDRQRMIDDGISPRIYTIRDRLILAVAEVIRMCREILSSERGGVA